MMLFGEILLWCCVYGLVHSYVVYPLLLRWAAAKKTGNQNCYERTALLPQVSFIMSLYNEESVIEEKLRTLSESTYPKDRLHLYIGSDCSSDATNVLVKAWAATYPQAHFFPFEERRGKPSVINDLIATAKARFATADQETHLLIISDANVLVEPDTIYQLAKHFKNTAIGLVDSNIQHPQQRTLAAEGIAASEDHYISREVHIKNLEGRAWGRTMAPFRRLLRHSSRLVFACSTQFLSGRFLYCHESI